MSLVTRFTSLFNKDQIDAEIDQEQEFHLAALTDELVEAGLPREEAGRRARRQFGNRMRMHEESRDARLFAWLESAAQDISYGLRTLVKSPSFAAVAILTLALGIGANTAIFSVVNGVLLNPLPYPDPGSIVTLYQNIPYFKKASISYPNFLDWQRMNRSFSSIAAYRPADFTLSGWGEPEHLQGAMVSAGFFEIFGVKPVLGRTFTKAEDRRYSTPVVMIAEDFWRHKFGARPDILGKRLIMDGVGRTVVGIVPSGFYLQRQDIQRSNALNAIYIPVGQFNDNGFHGDRASGRGMDGIGRLKHGVTLEQGRQDMNRVAHELAAAFPDVDNNVGITLVPLKEEITGDMRPALLVLLTAVSFVLMIACVNVANLLLARSTARQREFAIRLALGAGPTRILRQLLTESVLLALIGGVLGLILAHWGTAAAIAAAPHAVPRAEDIGLDTRVLLFTFVVSLGAGILFGLAPALRLRSREMGHALKESGRSVVRGRTRLQRAFVVVEIALALVLLVGSGLMIRTLFVLWQTNPGFDPHRVITFSVTPPFSVSNASPDAIRAFLRQLHDQLASTPRVDAVALSAASNPMGGDSESYFWFVGRPRPQRIRDLPLALFYVVDPDYRKTLQIQLKRGRFFTESDTPSSAPVIIIDETLAERFFRGQDPIGQHLDFDVDPSPSHKRRNPRIVGIVSHVNQWGLDADSHPDAVHAEVYLPISQCSDNNVRAFAAGLDVYVRGQSPGEPSFAALRDRLSRLNPGLVAFNAHPLERIVLDSVAAKRFTMALLTVFASVALFLASIGIYGVLSYLVGQRTQEIGIRMALGAHPGDVLRMILTDGARMILTGIVIGITAALGLTQLMAAMLFGIKPTDVPTFTLVPLTLCVIALLACYVPARRAMRIDPMIALREE